MNSCVGTTSILGMATANPVNFHLQSEYPDMYFRVTNSDHMTKLKQAFKRICENVGVRKRHMFLTEEILKKSLKMLPDSSKKLGLPLSTQMEMATREVPLLGMEAAEKAIFEWGRSPSDITHLVFATTSAVSVPTPDLRLAALLRLRPSVQRHFLFGNACTGAAASLRLAKSIADSDPSARVLLVCSENMVVNFSAPFPSLEHLISQALFSDGAAAAVVGNPAASASETPLFRLVSASQMLIPDTEAAMVGSVGESGVSSKMSASIPAYARTNVRRIVEEALAPVAGVVGEEELKSMFYAVHPGAGPMMDQITKKLGLGPEKLRAGRRVLAEYGNMWGPTVLFILDEVRRTSVAEGKSTTGDGFDWGLMLSFGPGFTAETMVLESVSI